MLVRNGKQEAHNVRFDNRGSLDIAKLHGVLVKVPVAAPVQRGRRGVATLVSLDCQGECNDYPSQVRARRLQVHLPAEGDPPPKRRSIKDLPFYGMWADRDDITDGVSYVDNLRENPRG